jgi:hypothetical protein
VADVSRLVLKIICLVSGVLFLVFGTITVCSIVNMCNAVASLPQVSIIGGANSPTMQFFIGKMFRSPVFGAAVLALVLFAGTGLALVFGRKKKNSTHSKEISPKGV